MGTAITASLGNNADGAGFLDPLLGGENEAIETSLLFNPIEFDGIKTGVIEMFPDA